MIVIPSVVLVITGGDIAWDTLVRSRFRPGHALGAIMRAIGFGGVFWWIAYHQNVDAQFGMSLFLASVLLLLIGNIFTDRTDIADQEVGRMSKWGDWWDKYDNNLFANRFDVVFSYFATAIVAGALLITLCGSRVVTDMLDHSYSQPSIAADSSAQPIATAKPSVSKAHKHHAVHARNSHH